MMNVEWKVTIDEQSKKDISSAYSVIKELEHLYDGLDAEKCKVLGESAGILLNIINNEQVTDVQNDKYIESDTHTYKNYTDFKKTLEKGKLNVGDMLMIKDMYGLTPWVVAHIKDGKVYMVRKWLLPVERALIDKDDDVNSFDWLNNEYRASLPESILKDIVGNVTLPSEKEVFGKNEYGTEKKDEEHFEYFKNVLNRVTATSPDAEYTKCWWTRTPYGTDDIVSASDFAYAYDDGGANGGAPSDTWIGLRPHLILK